MRARRARVRRHRVSQRVRTSARAGAHGTRARAPVSCQLFSSCISLTSFMMRLMVGLRTLRLVLILSPANSNVSRRMFVLVCSLPLLLLGAGAVAAQTRVPASGPFSNELRFAKSLPPRKRRWRDVRRARAFTAAAARRLPTERLHLPSAPAPAVCGLGSERLCAHFRRRQTDCQVRARVRATVALRFCVLVCGVVGAVCARALCVRLCAVTNCFRRWPTEPKFASTPKA